MMLIWKHVLVVVVHVVDLVHDHDHALYLDLQAFPPCQVSLAKVILAHHHPMLVKVKYNLHHQDLHLFHHRHHHQVDVVVWVPKIS